MSIAQDGHPLGPHNPFNAIVHKHRGAPPNSDGISTRMPKRERTNAGPYSPFSNGLPITPATR